MFVHLHGTPDQILRALHVSNVTLPVAVVLQRANFDVARPPLLPLFSEISSETIEEFALIHRFPLVGQLTAQSDEAYRSQEENTSPPPSACP